MERTIRLSWNANGVDIKPFTDPQKLFDHLFLNLTLQQRRVRRDLIESNGSILDAVKDQFADVRKHAGRNDRERLGQYATAIRDLEGSFSDRKLWVDRDKPEFDISEHYESYEVTVANRYNSIFDMVAYSFESDLTRVATVGFSPELSYTDVDGVNRGYHACTHNGKKEDVVDELVAIESFQISQLSRCLKKLDQINEPGGQGTLLDNTVVLFGSSPKRNPDRRVGRFSQWCAVQGHSSIPSTDGKRCQPRSLRPLFPRQAVTNRSVRPPFHSSIAACHRPNKNG